MPVELQVRETARLEGCERDDVFALFHAAYRDADDAYLGRSLGRFRFVAFARDEGRAVGFGLGETRVMDLPRLPSQATALGGICCVDPAYRRHGLLRRLEAATFTASGVSLAPRFLGCGRVAHAASFRTMTSNPSHVPRRGLPPTPWQREVGIAIAREYGVEHFDPDTFVCRGRGVPVGYPVLDLDVTAQEQEAFAAVDRSRGDSLLGLCWYPDAPPLW